MNKSFLNGRQSIKVCRSTYKGTPTVPKINDHKTTRNIKETKVSAINSDVDYEKNFIKMWIWRNIFQCFTVYKTSERRSMFYHNIKIIHFSVNET